MFAVCELCAASEESAGVSPRRVGRLPLKTPALDSNGRAAPRHCGAGRAAPTAVWAAAAPGYGIAGRCKSGCCRRSMDNLPICGARGSAFGSPHLFDESDRCDRLAQAEMARSSSMHACAHRQHVSAHLSVSDLYK